MNDADKLLDKERELQGECCLAVCLSTETDLYGCANGEYVVLKAPGTRRNQH